MMWKRQTNTFSDTPEPVTPYQRAAQAWDDRIGSARVQAKNWRLAALLAIAMSAMLAAGLVWRSTQSYVTPYVIELSSEGAVRAVGPADATYEPTDAQIAYHLAAFIKNTRSVSIDPIIVRQNWLQAYAYATDRAASTLNTYAQENDPFAEIGTRSVSVDVSSVVRASDDSFTLRWRETTFRNGAEMGRENWTATLSIISDAPRDAETLHQNPLGLYVHGINWSKDLN
ncbi:conjugal transfer protein TrbF [Henriciella mobilis]|uniref:conjugal transfer protein TrbF n=1 Tax=Henriciella mobilis TaxID=2305467 RepID=UPI000E666AE0|nr:conjugal transfer protein TrbF [Henriciella mobilis]RIJ14124.1 conjugal transfer protein TrbF [Henriciella mobilis]RIJ21486.1 conjugal transfer protein TrbF [Henriciella mobilis]